MANHELRNPLRTKTLGIWQCVTMATLDRRAHLAPGSEQGLGGAVAPPEPRVGQAAERGCGRGQRAVEAGLGAWAPWVVGTVLHRFTMFY